MMIISASFCRYFLFEVGKFLIVTGAEVTINFSDGELGIQCNADGAPWSPGFMKVSQEKNIPPEMAQKIKEVYEFVLDFSPPSVMTEHVDENGKRYRVFTPLQ